MLLSDLKLYCAANTPGLDPGTAPDDLLDIGGAIDESAKFDFSDFSGTYQIVSSEAADVYQTITVTYRDPADITSILTEELALNGQTPATSATQIERILRGGKSASTAGDVALEKQGTAEITSLVSPGTASDEVVLDDAYASDADGAYAGMVVRVIAGPNQYEIAECIAYDGGTHTMTLNRAVSWVYDQVAVRKGMFFDRTPSEIMTVVRFQYDAKAEEAGGADRNYYVKGFFKHTGASDPYTPLVNCKVEEAADPTALVTFTIDDQIDSPTTNGYVNNRLVAPTVGVSVAFNNTSKTLNSYPTGSTLAPGEAIGVGGNVLREDGAAQANSTWTPRFTGVI